MLYPQKVKLIFHFSLPAILVLFSILQYGCASSSLCPDCTPLASAIVDGDYSRVKELLPLEKDINAAVSDGQTVLHYAAMREDVKIAELLLENGADLSRKNINGETPLNTAIRYGTESVALLFIEYGANVEATVPNGPSVLSKAASRRNLELVKRIVEKGADPNRPDGRGETPLFAAAESGSEAIFSFLLEEIKRNDQSTKQENDLLFAAVNRGSAEITKSLINSGIDPNAIASTGVTPIIVAAYSGYEDLVKLLIELGASPHSDLPGFGNALHASLLRGHYNIAEYLVEQNVQPVNIPTNVFSSYASAIGQQMVAEKIAQEDYGTAKTLLHTAIVLFNDATDKGKLAHDQAGSDVWKIRFSEFFLYSAVAATGPDPYIMNHNSVMNSHLTAQDVKTELKELQKQIEGIIADSEQRIKLCESMLPAGYNVNTYVSSEVNSLQVKAEKGDPKARFTLASAFDTGNGASRSRIEALNWYTKAAAQGYAEAQNSLGSIYQAEERYAEALPWYQKAADQGHALAINNLAYLYDLGLGVPQDRQKGHDLYLRSANLGWAEAMFNLANMYGAGQLGEVDYHKMYVWCSRSNKYAQPGWRDLKQRSLQCLDYLNNKLSHEQIEKAEKEAGKWAPIKHN